MAQTFNTTEELFAYIENNLPLSLEQIGEEIKDVLRNNVQHLWYDAHPSTQYYDRTMEYINSLSVSKAIKVSNVWEVEIYFATDLILPHQGQNGKWGQHESVHGEDVAAAIPYYIENGNHESGNPIYSYEGVHPTEVTKQWLIETDYVKKRLIEILGEHGFNISIQWI